MGSAWEPAGSLPRAGSSVLLGEGGAGLQRAGARPPGGHLAVS